MLSNRRSLLGTGLIAVTLVASCAGESASDIGEAARARIQAQRLGPGWHAATIGSVGDCMVAMVGEPPEAPVRLRVIQFAEVTEMMVSDRYDGLPGPDGVARAWAPEADTTGEGWREAALDPIRAKHGCTPGE